MMEKKPILPPRLKRGDTIGLFCPAGPARQPDLVEKAVQIIRDLGFKVKVQGNFQDHGHYLADTDEARAANLHALWDDDRVKCILAIRGGFGCLRMIPHLDLELLRKKPKLLIGFSDVGVLINMLAQHLNIVAVHGPVLTSLNHQGKEGINHLFRLLSSDAEDTITPSSLEILRGDNSRGRLIGGNLTTLVHLIGTPWEPKWNQSILILEDTGEHIYRLDRMLTHLALAGRLNDLAGLILGRFDPGNDDRLETLRLQEAVWQRILELTPHTAYPIWADFPLGHQGVNLALPMGVEASMDSSSGKLRIHWDSVQSM